MRTLLDTGSGRVFVTIFDDDAYEGMGRAIAEKLSATSRSILLRSAAVTGGTWEGLSEVVGEELQRLGIRQASLIGLGAGATLAQNVTLATPKLVRSLVLVDATSRPHPSRHERFVDWVESKLPFGLPLRLGNAGCNVQAYLHRVRSPVMVAVTRRADAFARADSKTFGRMVPTAWQIHASGSSEEEEITQLTEAIVAFQEVPAKCPQKNARKRNVQSAAW
jgi:pimeloyl-ACP methyl ester carboxylesterase